MAKLSPSRLSGVHGMRKFTADQLFAHAEKLEAQIKDPANTDDPKWLQQWADKIRWLARQKEKAKAHKDGTRRRLTNR